MDPPHVVSLCPGGGKPRTGGVGANASASQFSVAVHGALHAQTPPLHFPFREQSQSSTHEPGGGGGGGGTATEDTHRPDSCASSVPSGWDANTSFAATAPRTTPHAKRAIGVPTAVSPLHTFQQLPACATDSTVPSACSSQRWASAPVQGAAKTGAPLAELFTVRQAPLPSRGVLAAHGAAPKTSAGDLALHGWRVSGCAEMMARRENAAAIENIGGLARCEGSLPARGFQAAASASAE